MNGKNPFRDCESCSLEREYPLHIAIVKHIRRFFPQVSIVHIANQSRNAKEAFFNKKMGVYPGAADLLLVWDAGECGFMEIKTPSGKISTVQNKFLSAMAAKQHRVSVVRSVRDAHSILKKWGVLWISDGLSEPDLADNKEKMARAFDFYGL